MFPMRTSADVVWTNFLKVHTAFQNVAPFSKAAFNGLLASSLVMPPKSVRAV
jgi:hypothetical protein